mmetsp:Transcript_131406/g.227524  ORF Transcript_131406/g.227524 Transcript_131406/m.227524 type:complete len:257 (-) Transcript_131406:40-810(-)
MAGPCLGTSSLMMKIEDGSIFLASLPMRILMLILWPLLWWDRFEKERYIQMIPLVVRKHLLRLLFIPTLLWNYMMHRCFRERRWWDKVDDRVVLGACPLPWQVPAMVQMGVTGVVNCTDEYTGPTKQYAKAGIKQLRIPTMDFHMPSYQHVTQALQFIRSQPGVVYIHCKAGRGRAATVAACWIISSQKVTPLEAQSKLKQIRPHVSPSLWKRSVVHQTYEETVHDIESGPRVRHPAGDPTPVMERRRTPDPSLTP